MNYTIILICYALRGFGYPLFAYSFLVWVSYRTPQEMLSKAVGWFWFVFQLGLSVIGAFIPVTWFLKSAKLLPCGVVYFLF